MSNNQKNKKKKVPLSYDKKKELIYIITIAVLATTIVVMFALKFADRIFDQGPTEEQKHVLSNGEYYEAVDPYAIPDRPEDYIADKYENEIIVNDIWYRMNLPFPITSRTITNEFPDAITRLTGLQDNISAVNSLSYVTSISPDVVTHDKDGNEVIHETDEIPFILMIINCRESISVPDVITELNKRLPKNLFGEEYPMDDIIVHSAVGNKITLCMMSSNAKQTIGFSAADIMRNLDLYLTTYDGRYKDKQPPIYNAESSNQ